MKANFKKILTVLLVIFITHAVFAQTYNITSNKNWSALSPSPDWCTGCTFNISSGIQLTINSSTGCTNCTFNGGNVIVSTGFAFTGGTLNVDSAAFNSASAALYPYAATGGTSFTNGKVGFNVPLTCQACSFTNETVHIDITSAQTFTLQSSGGYTTSAFTNSTITMGAGLLYANVKVTLNNSSMTLTSANLKSDVGQFLLNSSNLYLYGSSVFSATAGPIAVKNNSEILVGNGPLASTAAMDMGSLGANLVQIYDNSMIKVTNGNNNYKYQFPYQYTSSAGVTNSYSTSTNTISCNHGAVTGYANSCATNYVYGCATLNASGALGCATLALSAPELTARPSGGKVSLSWQTTATDVDRFLLLHSIDGNDWTLVGEVKAGAFQSSYSVDDPKAQTGDNYYRLQQVDMDGHIVYSLVSKVSLEGTHGETTLYPNPVKGHTVYLKTPSTDAVIVKIFTPGGQLLSISPLKGQSQYSIQLPAPVLSNSYVLVQVIGNGRTQTFTVLEQ